MDALRKEIADFYEVPYKYIESIDECLIGSDYELNFQNNTLFEVDLQYDYDNPEHMTEVTLYNIAIMLQDWISDWLERGEFEESEIEDLIEAVNWIVNNKKEEYNNEAK